MANILVADDAPAILDVLEDVLTAAGHRVTKAGSGAEALRQFKEARPDLAVIDVVMPDIDGLGVLDSIRGLDGEVPVILITGIVSDAITRQLERHHAVAFFEKGSGLDRFIELVNKTLGVPGTAGS